MTARQTLFAGVELGGTKCVCSLASGPDDIREQITVSTGEPESTLRRISDQLQAWSSTYGPIQGLGIGSFGPLDRNPASPTFGQITTTGKLGWQFVDVVGPLRGAVSAPTAFDTDVNGAVLAEALWGAAPQLTDIAYVTVGTGVGVGLMVNGGLVHGFAHPELGHARIAHLPGDPSPGACRLHQDCVEGFASGPSIEAYTGMAGRLVPPEHPVWQRVTYALGQLLHTLVLATAPHKIILAGGVLQSRPELLRQVRVELLESLRGYVDLEGLVGPIGEYVVPPGLAAQAGPLGAIALAVDAHRDRR